MRGIGSRDRHDRQYPVFDSSMGWRPCHASRVQSPGIPASLPARRHPDSYARSSPWSEPCPRRRRTHRRSHGRAGSGPGETGLPRPASGSRTSPTRPAPFVCGPFPWCIPRAVLRSGPTLPRRHLAQPTRRCARGRVAVRAWVSRAAAMLRIPRDSARGMHTRAAPLRTTARDRLLPLWDALHPVSFSAVGRSSA